MFKIEGTRITLTRGDTFQAEVGIKYEDGTQYVPTENDYVRFALKRNRMTAGGGNFADVKPLILKPIPTETMLLELNPEDTANLPFGDYKYDIELTYSGGLVCTFIADADFVLAREVH